MGDERGGPLSVALLGGFVVHRAGGQRVEVRSGASRSLIGFLALNGDRPLTRSLISGTLWPDDSDSGARTRLRRALHHVNVSLGRDVFIRQGDTVSLDRSSVGVDVHEFTDAIDRASTEPDVELRIEHLDRAVDLYRGDLLDGYYHEWATIDREGLRRRFLGALSRLCDLHSAARRDDTALEYARRLAAEEPWSEHAHRRVMWLAAATGRSHEAVRQFEICREVLDADLGVEPTPETRDLYESIVHDREIGRHRTFSTDGPIIGRDFERSTAAALLDATDAGTGAVVLIEGDTGVGKTRLLRTIIDDAAWRGMSVMEIRGHPGQHPYGAVVPAIDATDPAIFDHTLDEPTRQRVNQILDPGSATGARRDEHVAMQDAAAQALAAPSAEQPLIVAIDDAHQLDAASAATIGRLGELTRSSPLIVLAAYRHPEARARAEVWNAIRALDRMEGRTRFALGPLSPGQTEDLAWSIVGHEIDPGSAAALHRATGGVPYLVVEALRDAGEGGPSLAVADAVDSIASHFVEARTRDLSADAVTTLRLLSLLATPVTDLTLKALGSNGLRDLVSRGLVSRGDAGVEPASLLIRRAVVERIPHDVLLGLHSRIGEALEHTEAHNVDALAHHFLESGDDGRAAPYLVGASDRAIAVHEYGDALERLRQADRCLARSGATQERIPVLASLLETLDLLGHREEQEQVLDSFAALASETEAIDAMRHRARWLSQGDDVDGARRAGRKALEAARDHGDHAREVAALATLAMVECRAGDAASGAALLDTAAGFGRLASREQADARNALGQNLVDLGRFDEAETQLLAAQALYRDLADARGEVDVVGMLAAIRMQQGDAQQAAERYEQAISLSASIGYREGEAKAECNLGIALTISGRTAKSLEHLDRGAESLRRLGHYSSYLTARLNAAWLRHTVLGEDDEAQEVARDSLRWIGTATDRRSVSQAEALLGSIAGRRGEWPQATKHFDRALDLARVAEDVWLEAQHLAHYAAAAVMGNEVEVAQELIRRGRFLSSRYSFDDLCADFELTAALVMLKQGSMSEAVEIVAGISALPPDLGEIRTRAVGSLAYRAAGDLNMADKLLEDAWLAICELLDPFDDPQRTSAITTVPLFDEVYRGWTARMPERRTVLATSASKGPREPVKDGERFPIEVTVHKPDDLEISNTRLRRQARLRRALEEAQRAQAVLSVHDLVDVFEASEKTIRRDLHELRLAGFDGAVTRGSLRRL